MKKNQKNKRDELIYKLKKRQIKDVDEIKNYSLEVSNPMAAGGDISSTTIFVCIPPKVSLKKKIPLVYVFGCFTDDLYQLRDLLLKCKVPTFAMESTSVYWIPLYDVLSAAGIEVCLVNPKKYRMIPGRKNDEDDAIWLQTLHSYGLLKGSFHPAPQIKELRTLMRLRDTYVKETGRFIQRMQKCMTEMNVLLHNVISDIAGETGMSILKAILNGERDAQKLADLSNFRIKASREEVVKSLQGNWKKDQLFALKINLDSYENMWKQIREIDNEIEELLKEFPLKKTHESKPDSIKRNPHNKARNNPVMKTALEKHLWSVMGVDLTRIDGLGAYSVLQIISEVGTDLGSFPSEKHFASYLGLVPRTDISNGRILRSKTDRIKSQASLVFRKAVLGLVNSKTSLGAYYRRLRARIGKLQANVATARKLACIYFRMIRYGNDYVDIGETKYKEKQDLRHRKLLIKNAQKLGLLLVDDNGSIIKK